jgi:hypothetical protein
MSHRSKGQATQEVKSFQMLHWPYWLHIFKGQRVLREGLTVCVVMVGSAPRAGINLTILCPKVF